MSMLASSLTRTAATLQTTSGDGRSFSHLLAAVPSDPASIFTILLVVASVAVVVWFGRSKGGNGGTPS